MTRLFGGGAAPELIEKASPAPAESPGQFKAANLIQEVNQMNFAGDVPVDEHPGARRLSYRTLAYVAGQSIISPFLSLRVGQVGEHGIRRRDKFSPGTEIRLRDPKARLTPAAEKRINEIWEVLTRGGSYRARLEMLARDSWRYDQANFEVAYSRGGKPWAWQPADAATMRLAAPTPDELGARVYDPQKRMVVQLIENQIVRRFEHHEMAWGIRRPRTDIDVNGYGYPEQQEAIDVLADLLNAKTHNSLFFQNGMHASTMLLFRMHMEPELFKAASQKITAKLRGVENVHRLATVLVNPGDANLKPEDVTKLDLSPSNKDMEFQQYFNFLHKLLCAVWGVHPAELGLGDPADMGHATLNNKGAREEILMARERGLRPGLRAFEHWFDEWVVRPYDADFELRMEGMDSTTPEALAELRSKELSTIRTMNELRDQEDLPRLDSEIADFPMNQTFITAWMQLKQAEQAQAQGQEDGGEQGGEGQEDGESWEIDSDSGEASAPVRKAIDRATRQALHVLEKAIGDGKVTRRRPYRKGQRQALMPGSAPDTYAIVDVNP